MTDLAKSLSKLICLITVKTGEDGKMFGTVTSGMIADQLKTQFDVTLDKRKIHLEHPIRALGDQDVELRLHADVITTLKVRVESTTPPPAPPAAPAPEAKKEEPRTEKRGRRPEPPRARAEAGDRKPYPAAGQKPQGAERPPRPRGPRDPSGLRERRKPRSPTALPDPRNLQRPRSLPRLPSQSRDLYQLRLATAPFPAVVSPSPHRMGRGLG